MPSLCANPGVMILYYSLKSEYYGSKSVFYIGVVSCSECAFLFSGL